MSTKQMIELHPDVFQRRWLEATLGEIHQVLEQIEAWDVEHEIQFGERAASFWLESKLKNSSLYRDSAVQAVSLRAAIKTYKQGLSHQDRFYTSLYRTSIGTNYLKVSGMAGCGSPRRNMVSCVNPLPAGHRYRNVWIARKHGKWWLEFDLVPAHPCLTQKEASRVCGVPEEKIREQRVRLQQLGAFVDANGWQIPVSALQETGLLPYKTPTPPVPVFPTEAQREKLGGFSDVLVKVFNQARAWDVEHQKRHGSGMSLEQLWGVFRENQARGETRVGLAACREVIGEYVHARHEAGGRAASVRPRREGRAARVFLNFRRLTVEGDCLRFPAGLGLVSCSGFELGEAVKVYGGVLVGGSWLVECGSQWWLFLGTERKTPVAESARPVEVEEVQPVMAAGEVTPPVENPARPVETEEAQPVETDTVDGGNQVGGEIYGLAQAARLCRVSEKTIRRRKTQLQALGATCGKTGWRIPKTALEKTGLLKKNMNREAQPAADSSREVVQTLLDFNRTLRENLERERQYVDKLNARVDVLEQKLSQTGRPGSRRGSWLGRFLRIA